MHFHSPHFNELMALKCFNDALVTSEFSIMRFILELAATTTDCIAASEFNHAAAPSSTSVFPMHLPG